MSEEKKKEICAICGDGFEYNIIHFYQCRKCRIELSIKNSIRFVKTYYPEVSEKGVIINGKHWSIEEISRRLCTKKIREHNCDKDMICKACGNALCIDCCHWSPMLYTYPNDVYCPTCCPSCGFAKSISKNPNDPAIKELLDDV